jgi:hypothetical protein
MKKLIYILGIVTVLVTFSSCTVEELLQIEKAKESGVVQPAAQSLIQAQDIDTQVITPRK